MVYVHCILHSPPNILICTIQDVHTLYEHSECVWVFSCVAIASACAYRKVQGYLHYLLTRYKTQWHITNTINVQIIWMHSCGHTHTPRNIGENERSVKSYTCKSFNNNNKKKQHATRSWSFFSSSRLFVHLLLLRNWWDYQAKIKKFRWYNGNSSCDQSFRHVDYSHWKDLFFSRAEHTKSVWVRQQQEYTRTWFDRFQCTLLWYCFFCCFSCCAVICSL